ncbi:hypothetical protein WAI453_005502 [Rhynchosporium graminicola]
MFDFIRRSSTPKYQNYTHLGDDSGSYYDIQDKSDEPKVGTSFKHVAVLYTVIILLLIIQILSVICIRPISELGSLGSYEAGFATEIRPDAKTLSLHKVKFSGGVIFDENGTASISHTPGEPDYFGPPSLETEGIWENVLRDRFLKVEAKDWPSEAIQPQEQDLVEGSWRFETSGFHVLHCLNYVRKSLSPEYYTKHKDPPNPDPKSLTHSGHLKHCLEQIRQSLMCQLDMTPTPRTWRPAPAGRKGRGIFHADTDQWHVCRNFEAMRTWMSPLQEYHTRK